ncbi:hypothetical protein ACROYT_G015052 [Oculina patagonica]
MAPSLGHFQSSVERRFNEVDEVDAFKPIEMIFLFKKRHEACKKGRPPRKESRHIVWLATSTLKLWNQKKELGFEKNSKSEFAAALLHGEILKNSKNSSSAIQISCPRTPAPRVRPHRKCVASPIPPNIISPIPCKTPLFVSTPTSPSGNQTKTSTFDSSIEVDITGSLSQHYMHIVHFGEGKCIKPPIGKT